MKKREDINYRNNTFFEPEEYIFNTNVFRKGSLSATIDEYFGDLVYCFMEDHCCLALPLRLAERTALELQTLFSGSPFSAEKYDVIDGLLKESVISRNKHIDKIIFY
ncbi:hypothetical protein PO883_05920 [Massilia sp. DJPM01]|uniref:hypothetical protein n=1 Tax=Massilia sp. DJPM01 TaxID=3024404 RepID=UPI00259D52CB|nr:hypothetical protein [Massilia sp. DJPM01]MDM5176731.1 hypothetical protein [Massilia sp. DJPM01]